MILAPVLGRWCQRYENKEKRGRERWLIENILYLEFRLSEKIERLNFVPIVNEDDRFVARQVYLKLYGLVDNEYFRGKWGIN